MAGIVLPVPQKLLDYELGRTVPRVHIDETNGITNYMGWSSPNSLDSDPNWIITKYLYQDTNNPNSCTYYSTLVGVIWNLRAIYTYP